MRQQLYRQNDHKLGGSSFITENREMKLPNQDVNISKHSESNQPLKYGAKRMFKTQGNLNLKSKLGNQQRIAVEQIQLITQRVNRSQRLEMYLTVRELNCGRRKQSTLDKPKSTLVAL